VAAEGQTVTTMARRHPTLLAPRSLLHHIAQIKHLSLLLTAKDGDLYFGLEWQQAQSRATWQDTVEADRTQTDFKDMGTMRSRNRRTGSVVGDPQPAMAEEGIRVR